MDSPEFADDDDDDQVGSQDRPADFKAPQVKDELEADHAENVESNPALAEWFKVEPEDVPEVVQNSDTETENDSDMDALPDGEDDDWLKLDAKSEDSKTNSDAMEVSLTFRAITNQGKLMI